MDVSALTGLVKALGVDGILSLLALFCLCPAVIMALIWFVVEKLRARQNTLERGEREHHNQAMLGMMQSSLESTREQNAASLARCDLALSKVDSVQDENARQMARVLEGQNQVNQQVVGLIQDYREQVARASEVAESAVTAIVRATETMTALRKDIETNQYCPNIRMEKSAKGPQR